MAQDKPAIAETRENDETDQLTDNSKPIADAPKGSTARPEQPQAGTSTGDAGGRTRLGRFEVPSEKKDDLLDKGVTVPLVEGTRFHKAREALSSSVWEARRAASVDTTGESMERRDVPQNSYVDETGTWRGDSGLVLDRDRNAEVDAIRAERIVKLEERTSEEMQKLKDILGGDLEGWDFRLKGADRLKDKVAGTVDFSPRLSPTKPYAPCQTLYATRFPRETINMLRPTGRSRTLKGTRLHFGIVEEHMGQQFLSWNQQ